MEDEKTPCTVCYLGEFGEVYKAHLIKWHGMEMPGVVAVKTLKGTHNSAMVLRFVLYNRLPYSSHVAYNIMHTHLLCTPVKVCSHRMMCSR